MQWLSSALSKGPAIKADILDAGTELKGSKIAWKVHEGKLKENKEPCTIFTWEMTASSTDNELAAAKNALQRLKKTRHPTVLQYIDGVDPEAAKPKDKVIIVTEHVKPLEDCLAKEPAAGNKEGTAWGLNVVAQALQFITEDCGLIHGNVSRASVFVSDCGDWKLAGFELMSENTDTNSLLRRCEQLRIKRVLPPEVSKGNWSAVSEYPHAIDMWSYGCLMHEVYNGMLGRPEDLKDTSKLPRELVPLYQSTLKGDPTKRPRGNVVLENTFFKTQLVWINKELSSLQLQDAGEKEKFFLKLTESLDALPDVYLRKKLLPELLKAVEFGGAGTAAIAPMLKIGQRMKAEDFSKEIVPGVVRCFKSTDRATRIGLLQNMHTFAEHLTPALVENDIFPNLSSGFSDSVPALRELTVKSLIYLVPKLSERIINSQVLRALAQLQQDPEGSIRCNTTICLGKISVSLPQGTRDKVLLPAFTRSLLDPFPPGRIAALMSLSVTMEYYNATDIARKLLPAVGMCAVDAEKEVRLKAVECLKGALARLESESAKMSDEVNLHGGGAVSAPTISDSGVMGWAATAATASLSKKLWGVADGDSMGKGDAGLSQTKAAGAALPVAGAGMRKGGGEAGSGAASSLAKGGGQGADGWDDDDQGDMLAEWAAPAKSKVASKSGQDDSGWDDDWGGPDPAQAGGGRGAVKAKSPAGKRAPDEAGSDDWASLLDDAPSNSRGASGKPAASGAGASKRTDASDLDELFGGQAPAAGGGSRKAASGWDNDDFFDDLQNFGSKNPATKSQSSANAKGKPLKLGSATKLAASAADDWDDW